jgi:NRPS condensation-like uncharacterized protein
MDDRGLLFPLNSIDTGLFALISISETPQFHWIVKVDGEIDGTSLNQGLSAVLKAHPNLSARMCTRRMRRFRRVVDATGAILLTYLDLSDKSPADEETDLRYEEALTEWVNRPFDPFREFPVRVLLIKKASSESHLVFSFDHSSLDGIRSLRFIEEVVKIYNGGPQPEPSSLHELRRSNGDELLGFAGSQRATRKGFYRMVFTSLFHRFFVSSLNPPSRVFHDRSERRSSTAHLLGSVDLAELNGLLSSAKAAGFNINDVLLAACFRVIEKWNSLHRKATGRVSIMVPVNVGPESLRDVISNQLSYVSVSAKSQERSDPLALIRKTREDLRSMMASGIPFSVVYFLRLATYAPLPLLKALTRLLLVVPVQVDTIMLTNMGMIWPEAAREEQMGGSRITDIAALNPVVNPLGQTITVHTNHGSLHVCLGYKTGLFSKDKAQQFLDMYLDEVRSLPSALVTGP